MSSVHATLEATDTAFHVSGHEQIDFSLVYSRGVFDLDNPELADTYRDPRGVARAQRAVKSVSAVTARKRRRSESRDDHHYDHGRHFATVRASTAADKAGRPTGGVR